MIRQSGVRSLLGRYARLCGSKCSDADDDLATLLVKAQVEGQLVGVLEKVVGLLDDIQEDGLPYQVRKASEIYEDLRHLGLVVRDD